MNKQGTTSDRDERLDRIEFLLNDLLERQRISRLDNVMLLAYPLVLSCLTVLSSMIVQYEMLSRITIFGASYTSVLVYVVGFYGSAIIVTFFRFIRYYVRDDLKGRFLACRGFLSFIVCMVGSASVTVLVLVIIAEYIEVLVAPHWTWIVVELALLISSSLATFFLADGLVSRFTESMISWFQTNVPRRLEAERIHFADVSKRTATAFKRSKITSLVACLLYGSLVFGSILSAGMEKMVLYHVTSLILVIVLWVLVVFRKTVRRAISRIHSKKL